MAYLHKFSPSISLSILTLCLLLSLGLSADSIAAPRWQLIWSDEFEAVGLDESKWHIEDAALIKNNEKQYYSPSHVSINEGNLVILSDKKNSGGRAYTSGLVDTRGKFSMLYGMLEIRAKLPKGQGVWPALWLLPADGSWPPEIDLMEMLGHEPNKILMSHHWSHFGNHEYATVSYTSKVWDYSQDFHVYTLEWSPEKIRWFIDGVLRHEVTTDIPSKAMTITINTAIGGYLPGDPDTSTPWPQEMLVDYVRVYKQ